jgi:DNA-binding response OmpR family regulator
MYVTVQTPGPTFPYHQLGISLPWRFCVTSQRILCIDDCDTSTTLATILQSVGFDAHAADNDLRGSIGREFDVFILDALLTDKSLFDRCRQIRRIEIDSPIIVYSRDAFPEEKAAALDAGANAFIIKPDILALILTLTRLRKIEVPVVRVGPVGIE